MEQTNYIGEDELRNWLAEMGYKFVILIEIPDSIKGIKDNYFIYCNWYAYKNCEVPLYEKYYEKSVQILVIPNIFKYDFLEEPSCVTIELRSKNDGICGGIKMYDIPNSKFMEKYNEVESNLLELQVALDGLLPKV